MSNPQVIPLFNPHATSAIAAGTWERVSDSEHPAWALVDGNVVTGMVVMIFDAVHPRTPYHPYAFTDDGDPISLNAVGSLIEGQVAVADRLVL